MKDYTNDFDNSECEEISLENGANYTTELPDIESVELPDLDVHHTSEPILDINEDSVVSQYIDMGLDNTTIQQILNEPDERSWRGCENIDALQHPDFDVQRSFVKDGEGYREAEYGEKGSQRPDEIKFTEEGIDIREVKNWSNADALARNIEKQSADRYEMFGEDIHDLTYIVSPKFTLEECDKLNETCQNSGADIEFKYH